MALIPEFMEAFGRGAKCTLHVMIVALGNSHHMAEAAFKGLGTALGQAAERSPRFKGIPSTKGML